MKLRLHTGSPPPKAQIWEKQAGFILIKLFSEARVSHKTERFVVTMTCTGSKFTILKLGGKQPRDLYLYDNN